MTDLKLDKMSECILTIFSERRRLSVHDLAFLTQLPIESLAPYMIELWDQGYIKSPDMPPQNTLSTSQSFTITPKGDLYFQEKDRQARELRETRL